MQIEVCTLSQKLFLWELRQLDAAERLLFLRQLGAKSGIEVIESSRFCRPLGEKVIEVPASALEGSSWRLAGGYYHEAAHVGQEFGRASTLWGGKFATVFPKLGQRISAWTGFVPGTPTYLLNPVEAHAFSSGLSYTLSPTSNMVGLGLSRTEAYCVTDMVNASNPSDSICTRAIKNSFGIFGMNIP